MRRPSLQNVIDDVKKIIRAFAQRLWTIWDGHNIEVDEINLYTGVHVRAYNNTHVQAKEQRPKQQLSNSQGNILSPLFSFAFSTQTSPMSLLATSTLFWSIIFNISRICPTLRIRRVWNFLNSVCNNFISKPLSTSSVLHDLLRNHLNSLQHSLIWDS